MKKGKGVVLGLVLIVSCILLLNGVWSYLIGGGFTFYSWGGSTGIPVPGDYNADGKSDLAVWYPTATQNWWVRDVVSGAVITQGLTWGSSTMVPVSGDYNRDGYYDYALYDSTGYWHALSGKNTSQQLFSYVHHGGQPGAVPVSGDYDGDGKFDLALAVPEYANNRWVWYIINSSGSPLLWTFRFGSQPSSNVPFSLDFDNDGSWDIGIYSTQDRKIYIYSPKTTNYLLYPGLNDPASVDSNLGSISYGEVLGNNKSYLLTTSPSVAQPYFAFWSKTSTTSPLSRSSWPGIGDSILGGSILDDNPILVPGDYYGDGVWDIATYHPNGILTSQESQWAILNIQPQITDTRINGSDVDYILISNDSAVKLGVVGSGLYSQNVTFRVYNSSNVLVATLTKNRADNLDTGAAISVNWNMGSRIGKHNFTVTLASTGTLLRSGIINITASKVDIRYRNDSCNFTAYSSIFNITTGAVITATKNVTWSNPRMKNNFTRYQTKLNSTSTWGLLWYPIQTKVASFDPSLDRSDEECYFRCTNISYIWNSTRKSCAPPKTPVVITGNCSQYKTNATCELSDNAHSLAATNEFLSLGFNSCGVAACSNGTASGIISCYCKWNNTRNTCSAVSAEKNCPRFITDPECGTSSNFCDWTSIINGDCENGDSTVSQRLQAHWNGLPQCLQASCVNGTDISYPCVNTEELPFFNWFNFIIAFVCIGFIYFLVGRKL